MKFPITAPVIKLLSLQVDLIKIFLGSAEHSHASSTAVQ